MAFTSVSLIVETEILINTRKNVFKRERTDSIGV